MLLGPRPDKRRVDVPPVVVELVRGHAGLAVEEGEDLVGVRVGGLGGGDPHGEYKYLGSIKRKNSFG